MPGKSVDWERNLAFLENSVFRAEYHYGYVEPFSGIPLRIFAILSLPSSAGMEHGAGGDFVRLG